MAWLSKYKVLPVDFNLEVLRGNVTGHSMVFIAGHNDALTTTRITLHPTSTTADIDQSGLSTAATVDIASTDANDDKDLTGLRTVLLIGLDANGDSQTEVVTLEGQAEQTSANTYSAVNGLRGVTWGSTGFNEGTVWCGNGTFTSGVPATAYFSMEIQSNKGLTSYYVVPAGFEFIFRQLTMTVATTNKDVSFFIEQGSNGVNWFTEAILGMEPGEFATPIIGVPPLVAGTHIRIAGISSAAATHVTAILAGQLIAV